MPHPILVTGAAGFAGGHLLELLARDGAEVLAWHRPGSAPSLEVPRVWWRPVDLLDGDAVRASIAELRPSTVYHCAGAAHVGRSWTSTETTFAINVRGTHVLLDALEETGAAARVLIPSSAMVYRKAAAPLSEADPVGPTSPYGVSKLAQEMLGAHVRSARIAVTIARAFNHTGPRQDPSFVAPGFARQVAEIEAGRREPEIVVGNLDARRDILDVRDTVRAYRLILERGAPNRPYNVSSGRALTIRELLDLFVARARVAVQVRVDPARYRPNDLPLLVGDNGRLRHELGWAPEIPLEQTVDDVLEYWRQLTM